MSVADNIPSASRRKMRHPPGTVTPAEVLKMRFSSSHSAPPLCREFSGPDTVWSAPSASGSSLPSLDLLHKRSKHQTCGVYDTALWKFYKTILSSINCSLLIIDA